MYNEGILIIVSGPSGSGKGTVVSELVGDDDYALSISATTRSKRPGETYGRHYFFHTKGEFESMMENGDLLEWACFCGNYYGTPKDYVLSKLKEGKNVILEIEVQGALKVKEQYPECILVFMMPPSFEELKRRLKERNTEDDSSISKRIERALEEIQMANSYDYVVINDDIKKAAYDIKSICNAERMKYLKNMDIIENFKGEM